MRGARPFWRRPSSAFGVAPRDVLTHDMGVVDEAKSRDDPVPPICQAGEHGGLPPEARQGERVAETEASNTISAEVR
jgi:hypothetical protein